MHFYLCISILLQDFRAETPALLFLIFILQGENVVDWQLQIKFGIQHLVRGFRHMA